MNKIQRYMLSQQNRLSRRIDRLEDDGSDEALDKAVVLQNMAEALVKSFDDVGMAADAAAH